MRLANTTNVAFERGKNNRMRETTLIAKTFCVLSLVCCVCNGCVWYFKIWQICINDQPFLLKHQKKKKNSKIYTTTPSRREDNYCFLHLSHIFMAVVAISSVSCCRRHKRRKSLPLRVEKKMDMRKEVRRAGSVSSIS